MLLTDHLGHDYLEYVKDKPNPKQTWSSMRATLNESVYQTGKLLQLKMKKKNDNLENHWNRFQPKSLWRSRYAGCSLFTSYYD